MTGQDDQPAQEVGAHIVRALDDAIEYVAEDGPITGEPLLWELNDSGWYLTRTPPVPQQPPAQEQDGAVTRPEATDTARLAEALCDCGAMHKTGDTRDRLLLVLHSLADEDFDWRDADEFADALLPVVEQIAEERARQRAAEEIADAAERIKALADGPVPAIDSAFDAVVLLRGWAAAIRGGERS